jgi:hypothetical protein
VPSNFFNPSKPCRHFDEILLFKRVDNSFKICPIKQYIYNEMLSMQSFDTPPTPSQIYICLINQSINQFHLRYKYGKTFFKEFIYNVVYCILLLLTHVLL